MFDWLDEGLSLESLRRRLVIHPYFCISIFASTLPNILELFHRGPRNSRKLVRNFVRKLFFLCARAIDNYFEIVYSNITSRCWSDTENLVVTFACTLGLLEIQIVVLYKTLYFLFFKGTVPYTVSYRAVQTNTKFSIISHHQTKSRVRFSAEFSTNFSKFSTGSLWLQLLY